MKTQKPESDIYYVGVLNENTILVGDFHELSYDRSLDYCKMLNIIDNKDTWFLPSIEELSFVYANMKNIKKTCWSSTECNTDQVWVQDLDTGVKRWVNKVDTYNCILICKRNTEK